MHIMLCMWYHSNCVYGMFLTVKGKFTKGVDLSTGEASVQHGQGLTGSQTAENSEKSPASEEKLTHDGQESEGTRFLTNKNIQVINLPILNEKNDVCIFLPACTGLKSQHGIHKDGRHFEVANILEVYSAVPGV